MNWNTHLLHRQIENHLLEWRWMLYFYANLTVDSLGVLYPQKHDIVSGGSVGFWKGRNEHTRGRWTVSLITTVGGQFLNEVHERESSFADLFLNSEAPLFDEDLAATPHSVRQGMEPRPCTPHRPPLLEPFLTAANRNAVAIQAMIAAISDQIALVGMLDLDWKH